MNVCKRELRAGWKPFLYWSLGLLVLVFAGVTKATGVLAGGHEFSQLMEAFPRVVQALVGMLGLDIGTFGGYYAALMQYVFILTAVYAAWLGSNAVSRESVDKTYEFLFTKPRARSFLLARKLLAGGIYLTGYCVLLFLFSFAASATLEMGGGMAAEFALYAAADWLMSLVFFSLAALFSAAAGTAEGGAKLGNLAVLAAFALGVIYDMLEHGGLLRLLSPFKYFLPNELLNGTLNPAFFVLALAVSGAALAAAFSRFERRDLNAV